MNLPKNIFVFKPDKEEFHKNLQICAAVLCTSGNQLILESVYNHIPIAIMPCSDVHFEQIHNIKKYVDILKYALFMSDDLDLEVLIQSDMTEYLNDLKNILWDRDNKILNLVDI